VLTDSSRRHLKLPGEAAGGLRCFEGSQQLRPRPADEGAECRTNTGTWTYPGGGYRSSMTRDKTQREG